MARVAVAQCETCGRSQGERHLITAPMPSMDELEEMLNDGIVMATDGCYVEPDGICEHDHRSWALNLGLI